MPNPVTNFGDSFGTDLGNKLITKEYLMSVYPNIAQQIGKTPELWSWGYGNSGVLGDNTTTNKSTPITTLSGGSNWKQVFAGRFHTVATKTDGTLWTWGNNSGGRLGDNTTINKLTPVTTFAGGTNWKYLSVGLNNTMAIKTDGTLWIWGPGGFGRLGDNTATNKLTPVTTFAGGTNWRTVSGGYRHVIATKTDGTLWTWGDGTYGQLGINSTVAISTPVTTLAGGTNWRSVHAFFHHNVAIKTDGTLWTFGRGAQGQIGDGGFTNRCTPVTTFAGGNNWKQASAGDTHTAAVKNDGTLWSWGYASFGRLGNGGTSGNFTTPVTTFAGGTSWKQVSTGEGHTVATKTDGTLWTWGSGNSGRLGTNDTITRSTPVTTVIGGTNWKQVSAGGGHIATIKSSDNL